MKKTLFLILNLSIFSLFAAEQKPEDLIKVFNFKKAIIEKDQEKMRSLGTKETIDLFYKHSQSRNLDTLILINAGFFLIHDEIAENYKALITNAAREYQEFKELYPDFKAKRPGFKGSILEFEGLFFPSLIDMETGRELDRYGIPIKPSFSIKTDELAK